VVVGQLISFPPLLAGASDAHAMGTNLSLMAQLLFDWLDEVLPTEPSLTDSARGAEAN